MSPRPAFPFAVTFRSAALIFEGDGRPALYVGADDHRGQVRLYRVPEDARVTVTAPWPLPEGKRRVFLPVGSWVSFETPTGCTVLSLHAVRACRELLETLEAYGQERRAWLGQRGAA